MDKVDIEPRSTYSKNARNKVLLIHYLGIFCSREALRRKVRQRKKRDQGNFHTWNVLQGGKKLESITFEVQARGVSGCGLPGQSFQGHVAGKETILMGNSLIG